ncbi:MAG: 30S ribosomal protein S18 [Planctomycetota bacterium]|jgi:small subunit ribosomal protein S18|nr:30S ribosomal protein S18 [Planctomycetota bacterium]
MTQEITKHPKRFDYKDIETLQRYMNAQGRIHSAQRTGLKARQQRKLKRAIKYARFLSLLPYGI